MSQAERAQRFFSLHDHGFLMPNAWDAASARIFEQAGFGALGTTSAGIAYSRGRRDGQTLSREEMLREVRNIINAVRIPVSADIEAGYGDAPADVTRTVQDFVAAGVVGLNLEDATGRADQSLYPLDEQQRRIEAARRAASPPHGIYLNARTDTYLLAVGRDEEERFAETVRRGRAYREAGATSVFIPLATDLATIRALRQEIGGPITVMAFPGAPTVADLLEAGASRVSLGQGAMLAALGLLAQVAQELYQTGTYTQMQRTFYGFKEAEDLFTATPAPHEQWLDTFPVSEYPVGSQRLT